MRVQINAKAVGAIMDAAHERVLGPGPSAILTNLRDIRSVRYVSAPPGSWRLAC
jgi:hypothetical protein